MCDFCDYFFFFFDYLLNLQYRVKLKKVLKVKMRMKHLDVRKLVAVTCFSLFSLGGWADDYELVNGSRLVIPDGETRICDGSPDERITTVVVPKSVTDICYESFYSDINLDTIIFDYSLKEYL